MTRFLAFDFGAESGRAILATIEGRGGQGGGGKITLDEVHRFPSHNGRLGGVFQWNLLGLWEEIKTGLRLAGKRGKIDGVGVDTWGVDFGLLDERGQVIGNPVHYRDARTDGMMERLFTRVPKEQVFAATGIQFMQLNSLFQLYALKESGWPCYDKVRRLLFMPDLFHYLMSGRAANELTIASTSQMMDPRTRSWATPLLTELGLPTNWLGEIVEPGTVLGGMLPDVARETEFAVGTPIIAPATHDTASAVAAVPSDEPGAAFLSCGTWSLLGVLTDAPRTGPDALAAGLSNEIAVDGRIRLLKNIMGLWVAQECRRDLLAGADGPSHAELAALAAAATPANATIDIDDPILLPPSRPGDRMLDRVVALAAARGLPASTPGDVFRRVFEALAAAYARTRTALERIDGRPIRTIHLMGGGCRNALLCQLTADACGLPVVAGPDEGTALGNLLVQARSLGLLDGGFAACAAASSDLVRYEPRAASAAAG